MTVNVLRATLALVGGAVCVGGLATVLVPGAARVVSADGAVAWLGNDYLLVAILGVVGAVATIAVLARQSVRGVHQATPPDPEGLPTGRRPGARFDEAVEGWRGVALWLRPGRRERVRKRLFAAAVSTLTRTAGCSREEARRRVEAGTWTDDPEAAAFLASEGRGSLLATMGATLRGESPVSRRARRTVDAIERIHAGEGQ